MGELVHCGDVRGVGGNGGGDVWDNVMDEF